MNALLFQPIVDAKTHGIVGCALVLPPPRLTPEGRDSPNARELEDWSSALKCLQAWRKPGGNFSLLAPVSEQQLQSATFIAQLLRALEQVQLPASCIELEVSAHVATRDAVPMKERLKALREAGFSILIDGLGSGFSNVSQWLETPSTGLRIDEALTRRALERESAVLIESMLMIASACGLRTIATGVQDADAAAVLGLLGLHRLQGNYFGLPMDCQSFTQRLSAECHGH
jgi:EAL domain-containing protein (putative c-di-GMP-specific phosphodiesterase class I)